MCAPVADHTETFWSEQGGRLQTTEKGHIFAGVFVEPGFAATADGRI